MTIARLVLFLGATAVALSAATAPSTDLDKAFEAYWKAGTPKDAAKAAEKIVSGGADFDAVWQRLKKGRPYGKEKTGEFLMRASSPVGMFENAIEVPDDYDPATPLPLRVQLHGGVARRQAPRPGGGADVTASDNDVEGREAGGAGGGGGGLGGPPSLGRRQAANRISGERQIYFQPSGWASAPWWSSLQVDNITRVVDALTRKYNIDESQIYLTGISDGGTGSYYIAMRDATRWSAVMPLNGSIVVLGNPSIGTEGEVFPNNLVNTPLYIVNGGRDPLYPVDHVKTHVEWFKNLGIELFFSPQMNAGHDTSWWPYEKIRYEQFVHAHRRPSHPETVSWETERTDMYNRMRWLVVDKLGAGESDTKIPDTGYFKHKAPSGRVDVAREGNRFVAHSRFVKEFRLLLSPDIVDFARPVSVAVNDRPVFEGMVKKDVGTLMYWHAKDNDRTMLYGAEVKVVVP
jgi:dienelactone hydrolase